MANVVPNPAIPSPTGNPDPIGIMAYLGFMVAYLMSLLTQFAARVNLALPHDGSEAMQKALPINKQSALAVAPGKGVGALQFEAGTNAGTLKLVAYSGTSTTGVTVADNIGSGN